MEEYISTLQVPIKVAVLGCAVNGPGEAREADIGIAGARGEGLLFRKGQVVRKVPEETMVEELKKEIDVIAAEMAAEREKEKETLRTQKKVATIFVSNLLFYVKARQLHNRRAFTLHILDNDHIFQTYDPLLHNQ